MEIHHIYFFIAAGLGGIFIIFVQIGQMLEILRDILKSLKKHNDKEALE